MPTIYILDVTNRDGVQMSRYGLSKLQKTMLNIHLNQLGVHQSEIGFPFIEHEANYINANLELAERGELKPMILEGWCRGVPGDVHKALQLTKVKHLNISISTSDQMIVHKFKGKLDREGVIREMTEAADAAIEGGVLSLGVNSEDASRTDMDYLIKFAKAAKDHGAQRVRYCDTVGFDSPHRIYDRIAELVKVVEMTVEMHCHNDLGMVVANSIAGARAAVDNGQDAWINTTVNGTGERAGNADLISVLLSLKHAADYGERNLLDPKINLKAAWKLAKYASYAFGIPIPVNQVGVGANMFAHESGIHADGALKDRKNYELYDFEDLGRGEPEVVPTGRIITTGEYGGIKGLRYVYEQLGLQIENDEEARVLLEVCQYANINTQKPLTDDELRLIYAHPDLVEKIVTITPEVKAVRKKPSKLRELQPSI
ncbi:MAG: homocitrate synthase [Armatimonadetes bacterium]|nr:homocitrate synthase [Armatimonadota bacterium]